MTAGSSSSSHWWVRQQHEDFFVLQQDQPPTGGIVRGERSVKIYGPFPTRERAQQFSDREYGRTHKGKHEARQRR